MAGTNVGAWLIVVLAPLLFAGSAALLRWGLGRPREKFRLRCPNCSYDMRGHVPAAAGGEGYGADVLAAPLLVCPECGHDTKTLDNLVSKNRRRTWGKRTAMAVGVVGLCISSPCLFSAVGWFLEQAPLRAIRENGGFVRFQAVPLWGIEGRGGSALLPTCVRASEVEFAPDDQASKATLWGLGHLRHLKYIYVNASKMTDAHVARLAGLKGLKSLGLVHGAQITDAGIAHLKGLANLQRLELDGTGITDAGLAHLNRMSQLITLNLSRTSVSDAGMAHLKALPELARLYLYGTQVTDAGLAHLAELPQWATDRPPVTRLKGRSYYYRQSTPMQTVSTICDGPSLSLGATLVTDKGLAHIKKILRLEWLDQSYTQVTEAGMVHLQYLAHLRDLDLFATGVSQRYELHFRRPWRSRFPQPERR
jgi:hypothetical protein